MPRGGRRAGSGRPTGSHNKFSKRAAEQAAAEGKRPHELLFEWGMTGVIAGVKRKLSARDRIYCLTQCAPYIVPRLNTITVTRPRPPGEEKTWDEMTSEERLDLGRRMAYLLRRAEHELDAQEAPKPAEPPRLPFRPQPEPVPVRPSRAAERPPVGVDPKYALESLHSFWTLAQWSRLAAIAMDKIPPAYRPHQDAAMDERGHWHPIVTEAPSAWRVRLHEMGVELEAAAGVDLERATVKGSFAEPQRTADHPPVVMRRP